ncbi:hypothetical protein PENTCL1PPCAC_13467, partial [Pristionchus entomophagus]
PIRRVNVDWNRRLHSGIEELRALSDIVGDVHSIRNGEHWVEPSSNVLEGESLNLLHIIRTCRRGQKAGSLDVLAMHSTINFHDDDTPVLGVAPLRDGRPGILRSMREDHVCALKVVPPSIICVCRLDALLDLVRIDSKELLAGLDEILGRLRRSEDSRSCIGRLEVAELG